MPHYSIFGIYYGICVLFIRFVDMKTINILVLAVLFIVVDSVRPPSPICRPTPLPAVIPVTIGQTVRFDLQDIFSGYNLVFQGNKSDHISITPKYELNSSKLEKGMPFVSAKINHNGRFLGLITRDQFTELAIGYNHPESGVSIDATVDIEDQPHLHCFDVEEVNAPISNQTFAMIDCAEYKNGIVHKNIFLYIDLETKKPFLGEKETDIFVEYNHIQSRKIHLISDPFTRLEYLFRVILATDVDNDHQNQTYVEIFFLGDHPVQVQIMDVIDHTFLELEQLAILDYQVHFNDLYLLVKDRGIYQLAFSPSQRILHKAFMEVNFDAEKFRVQQMGFNDELHVVVANQNVVYQYEWDASHTSTLVNKYVLISGSEVEQLVVDANFVIIQSKALIDDQYDRKVWIFSRRSPTYTHAFGSFEAPAHQASIIIYENNERVLHLIHENSTYNIKLNLPELLIHPVTERASSSQDYVIKAVSQTSDEKAECRQTIKLLYLDNTNRSIFRTDLMDIHEKVVDSTDQLDINLDYQFFGPFMDYNVSFQVENSSIFPKHYFDKQHKAQIVFPPDIPAENITHFQMFPVKSYQDLEGAKIFGLIEYRKHENDQDQYPFAYINCSINLDDNDEEHHLRCMTVLTQNPALGKIKLLSQVQSLSERFLAIVFSGAETSFSIYYYSSRSLILYCIKKFDSSFNNTLTDVEITQNNLVLATFQYGKRIEVYQLDQLKIHYENQTSAKPIFTINSRVMKFFGVNYFSPVDVKLSHYFKQMAFIKTKSGILAVNINNYGLPELIFNIETKTAMYDFELTFNSLLLITQTHFEMYRLITPLRRHQPPFLLQKYDGNYTLSDYREVDSDGLYYLVENQQKNILVLHPNMPSTSIFYTELPFTQVSGMDAIRVKDKQFLFVQTEKQVEAWVLAEHPKLRTLWFSNNFTMNISAFNSQEISQPYSLNFTVLASDEIEIQPTDAFDIEKIRKLGEVSVNKNEKKIDKNITLNDTEWFTGNILHYNITCDHCNINETDKLNITLQNHLSRIRTLIDSGEPVYDMHATFNGIYGQRYDSFIKTYKDNDTIELTVKIPVTSRGQVCTKMVVPFHHQYVISLCELGTQVNAYFTFLNDQKLEPVGPIQTEALKVNKVKMQGDILMIVDNDDNPFIRSGGVYIYLYNNQTRDPTKMLTMLDYIDDLDLQIEGFKGNPSIASADFHKPIFDKQQFTIFITEARTGNIFAFTFELSKNRKQVVYVAKKMLTLNQLLPSSIKYPTNLKVQSIQIINFAVKQQKTRTLIDYVFLLTIRNWHHIELQLTIDQEIDVLFSGISHLFERIPYPMQLTNYIAIKHGHLNASYFAVSYLDVDFDWQIVAVYALPRFDKNGTNLTTYRQGVPFTRMLGAHLVRDNNEVSFAFNMINEHRLLLNDVGDPHLTEIELNRELKVRISNLDPSVDKPENITITAFNTYRHYNFSIELTWEDQNEEEKREILWIIITGLGVIMIIGLLVVWCRQNDKEKKDVIGTPKQSLLTVQDQFQPNFINRSSVDPDSVRGTVDYTSQPRQLVKEENSDEQDPLDQRIKQEQPSAQNHSGQQLQNTAEKKPEATA